MGAEGLINKSPSDSPPEVPSTERISLARHVPPDWLDRLLCVHADIAPNAPLEESIERVLAVALGVLDDTSLAVSFQGAYGPQIVARRPERKSQLVGPSVTPLFAEYELALTIPIQGEEDATLHVGAAERDRLADGGVARLFLDRVAQVLGAILRAARLVEAMADGERKSLNEQVIHLEKLASMGQLVASIVHELNNPLTAIIAQSDYLRRRVARGERDPGDLERLERINEAAERILRFSRELTEYASPRRVESEPVSIHQVIDRALGFCEHELDKTGVMVERHFGDVPRVVGVAGQLTQVFVNLFTNAAHAMREQGGLLSISTVCQPERRVTITVADDGHGVDASALPRIFDPFFTTKTDGTGTGLGLSIVQNIVTKHGGHIRARSNAPSGMVFEIELPVYDPSM